MSKLVVLKVGDGTFERGFPVTLQIGEEGAYPTIECSGKLPPAPQMPVCYRHWQSSYTHLSIPTRLSVTPNQVTNVSLTADCQQAAQTLQTTLNDWLRAETFRPIRETWLEALATTDELRVILQVEDAALQQLPWQLWDLLDRYPKAEIALSSCAHGLHPPVRAHRGKVKILALLGNSEGIDIQSDRRLLEQLPDADVCFLVEPDRQALTDQLWAQPWDILFFAGHSSSQGQGNEGRLFINRTDSLTISELKYALRQALGCGLKLAIFNSCDGLGLARDLAELRIPQVIVMREPVPDRIAQAFLQSFLAAFATGSSLYRAVRMARERLQPLEREFPCATWLAVIYQNLAVSPPTWQELQGGTVSRSPVKVRPLRLALTNVAIAAAVMGIRATGILQPLELNAYDQMLQLRATIVPEQPDNRLLVVKITDQDLQRQEKEEADGKSLSDKSLARLLDVLNKGKPRAIGLDLYRDDRGVPLEVVRRMQQTPGLVGTCKSSHPVFDPVGFPPPQGLPLEQVGFSDFTRDPDHVLRQQTLVIHQHPKSPCQAHYALSVKLALRYLANRGIQPSTTPDGYLQLGSVVLKPLSAASGGYQNKPGGGQILLNYRPVEVPTVPLSQILDEQFNVQQLHDRIILIGAVHQKTTDFWITPYSKGNDPGKIPGVLVQAQMVSHLLSAVLDGRSLLWVWDWWGEGLWLVGWAIVGSVAMGWRSSYLGSCLGLIAATVGLYALSFGVFLVGGWLPLVPAGLILLLTGSSHTLDLLRLRQSSR